MVRLFIHTVGNYIEHDVKSCQVKNDYIKIHKSTHKIIEEVTAHRKRFWYGQRVPDNNLGYEMVWIWHGGYEFVVGFHKSRVKIILTSFSKHSFAWDWFKIIL